MKLLASILLLFCFISDAFAVGEIQNQTSPAIASVTPVSNPIASVALTGGNENKKPSEVTEPNKTTSDQIAGQERFLLLGVSAALLLGFSIMALWFAGNKGILNFLGFLVGADNRYSNSKFQIALWFFIVIATYLAVLFLRLWEAGGEYLVVNIPQHLFLLSGMSALTYGGAKAITVSKSNADDTKDAAAAAAAAATAQGAADKAKNDATKKAAIADASKSDADIQAAKDAQADAEAKATVASSAQDSAQALAKIDGYNLGKPNFFKDLLHNDYGQTDFGDFQMLVVTLLAVGVYLFQVYSFMGHVELVHAVTLPDVDTTVLSAFGLGQGAYLVKKYVGNVGES